MVMSHHRGVMFRGAPDLTKRIGWSEISVRIIPHVAKFVGGRLGNDVGVKMTDNMELLIKAVEEHGQAEVARRLCYSPSAVNQALRGNYGGSLENMMQRVAGVFGSGTVVCPVMGEIPLRRCAEERSKAFGATNPQRAKLYIECQRCKER